MGLIAVLIPFVNLGSYVLQLTLHYLRMYLGLFKCSVGAVVPFVCLVSHASLLFCIIAVGTWGC